MEQLGLQLVTKAHFIQFLILLLLVVALEEWVLKL
jgi:hypothetical protein